MAEVKKILAQVAPVSGVGNYFATVPDSKAWIVSTVVICNGGAASTIRINAVNADDGLAAQKNRLYYDTVFPENETLPVTIGITLSNGDQLYCDVGSNNFAISVFGVEIDQTNVYSP
jgi:hypothetical protein